MKIGFIVICRYNSSRLPGKILKTINNKPILEYIIERLIAALGNKENIIIATSEERTDDPISAYCKTKNINIYRGSLKNVAERFKNCAKQNNLDFAARINGDNLFIDIQSLKEMIEIAKSNQYDFVSNVKNRTFPKGMSIEIVRTSFYEKMFRNFNNEGHFEHVTQYLYQNEEGMNYYHYFNNICPEAAGIQMAIDNEEDFQISNKIINTFASNHTNYGLKEIFKLHQKFKNERK